MRVIAGKFRNRNLKSSDHFRPTTDRVRETLFNILQNELEGSVFVDGFAGSGAVGIEALSRGAARVYFLESNRNALKVLESNLLMCNDVNWRIFALTAKKGLNLIRTQEDSVQHLFFDPPYDFHEYFELLEQAAALFPEAGIVLEHSARSKFTIPSNLTSTKEKRIGETSLSFFEVK
jgi:16S rRNA (guanine966-N2)-methyltransferase